MNDKAFRIFNTDPFFKDLHDFFLTVHHAHLNGRDVCRTPEQGAQLLMDLLIVRRRHFLPIQFQQIKGRKAALGKISVFAQCRIDIIASGASIRRRHIKFGSDQSRFHPLLFQDRRKFFQTRKIFTDHTGGSGGIRLAVFVHQQLHQTVDLAGDGIGLAGKSFFQQIRLHQHKTTGDPFFVSLCFHRKFFQFFLHVQIPFSSRLVKCRSRQKRSP